MKKLLLFVSLSIFIGLGSCNPKDNDECLAGDLRDEQIELSTTNHVQSSVTNNIRTYQWDVFVSSAITDEVSFGFLELFIDGNALQIPIEVVVYDIINGQIASETIAPDPPALGGSIKYDWLKTFDLFGIYNECVGGVQVRMQLKFETTGQESFDDAYLDDLLIEPNSIFKISYYEPR